jgi:hypothetical protein
VSFSPDGRRLASAADDMTVRVWDLATKKAFTLKGHTGPVRGVSFSPDGRRLASAADDMTVRVWDLAAKKAFTLTGHGDPVQGVSFSPDGRRLASASWDTVWVWDLATREAVTLPYPDVVVGVSFSPDGRRLASGSLSNMVRVWETTDTSHLWHLREATASEQAKQWFAAAFHLGRCIEQERSKLAMEALGGATSRLPLGVAASLVGLRWLEGRANLADLHQRRWNAYLELRDWARVEREFQRSRGVKANDPWMWHSQAWACLLRSREQQPVLTALGAIGVAILPGGSLPAALSLVPRRLDTAAFRRTWAQMARHFPDPKDKATIDALVWTRVLVGDGLDPKTAARLAALAQRNATKHPNNGDYLESYGAALYRAGHYREAVEQLNRAVAKKGAGGSVWQQCFLALAHHRLGNKTQARRWLQKAVRQIEKAKGPSWETWLQYSLLRAEAEAVLQS